MNRCGRGRGACTLALGSANDLIENVNGAFCAARGIYVFDFGREQLSSPRPRRWFSPASCTEQQQGRTITFGAQRGGGW